MSLNIDNKVYRNMQEQVCANARNILKIKDFLDGLDVEDTVIVLESLSSLNSEQMKVAEQPLAFIVYDDAIYLKNKEDATYFYFERMMKMELNTVITLSSAVIQVTKLNGATGITVSSVNVYSKSQIDTSLGLKADVTYVDTELAKKADLSGATFIGAVKAPTFEQSEANYSKDFSVYGLPAGLSVSPNSFKAFKAINGVLYVIAALVVSNDTESDITGGFTLYANNVNSQIGKKIFKCDGTDLTEASSATNFGWEICYSPITIMQYGGLPTNAYSRIYSPSANRLDATVPSQTWIAGGKYLVSIRVPIILV